MTTEIRSGDRGPIIPIEYERAVIALSECQKIDDAKYWSDKSDALAAWAKIYRSKTAETEARKLKLHAYRRMGQLAMELRPHRPLIKNGRAGVGFAPGPISLLKEHGFTQRHASAATHLGKLDTDKFNSLLSQPRPPIPTGLFVGCTFSPEWKHIYQNLMALRSALRSSKHPHDVAIALRPEEKEKAMEMTTEIVDWLDEFQRYLGQSHK